MNISRCRCGFSGTKGRAGAAVVGLRFEPWP